MSQKENAQRKPNPRWWEDGEPGTREQWRERAIQFEHSLRITKAKADTARLVSSALGKLVRAEYPRSHSFVEIAQTWGEDITPSELDALIVYEKRETA